MLNVTIGDGVIVRVVNEERVIPLYCGGDPASGEGCVEVQTTTECGIFRIRVRRWEESTGS